MFQATDARLNWFSKMAAMSVEGSSLVSTGRVIARLLNTLTKSASNYRNNIGVLVLSLPLKCTYSFLFIFHLSSKQLPKANDQANLA